MLDNVIGPVLMLAVFAATSIFSVMLVQPDLFTALLRLI